jgi:acyl transferase domain-containing protein
VKNSKTSNHYDGSEIAIVGLAGRFPGARDIETYWENLRDGKESITYFTDEQLLASGVNPKALADSKYVKARPIIDDVDMFDAAFFGFSPREAAILDPQHRLFMECVWQAIENAGYDPERYAGLISVYAGASMSTYLVNNLYANPDAMALSGEFSSYLYNTQDSLATGIAYKLNLKGTCCSVQTFCSTSLVAVHLARQSLLNFECDMAVAGGVSIFVPQHSGYRYQEGMIVSPDGHCRPFDAAARGTIFGNGLGAVVLKRMQDALADGDHIEAVIRGSATNNDGSLKVSFTAPSVGGQAAVIVEALADAGVEPDTIGYVEAHGTGTALGDPTEISALTKAFRSATDAKQFCAIGSVKSNIGHLDAAAGVSGLIKTILALKHQAIPPSLHFEHPNPEIDFSDSPFFVNAVLSPWTQKDTPRRAGISSFGVGGTNAHVILEEAPQRKSSNASRSQQLIILSAKTAAALDTTTRNFAEFCRHNSRCNLADAAFTLQTGRRAFNHRRMIVCRDAAGAVAVIDAEDTRRIFTAYQERRNPPVVFMFSGQGSQYVNMGLDLYRDETVFRETVDRCSEALRAHLGSDLRDSIYPAGGINPDGSQRLKQTAITQPALFTIEYALARLWMSWGVHPEAMLGHSVGEYVAACLAQVFSLEDALFLVAARARLMQQLPEGAMLAVALPEAQIQALLANDLSLAAVNAPALCVVSGEEGAVAELEKELGPRNVRCTRLHTSHAFHSEMVNPILAEFGKAVRQVRLNPPRIPIIANTTGQWMRPEEAVDPGYWVRHLRRTVRFSDGIQALMGNPARVLLEVGPGQTLCTLARQHMDPPGDHVVLSSIRHPQEDRSDMEFILSALGKLWLAGVEVNWSGFYQHEKRHRVSLPTYPFERRRYWIDPQRPPQGFPAYQAALSEPPADHRDSFQSEIEIEDFAPREIALQHDFIPPSNEVEKAIAAIWQKLLGVKQIGIHADYFDLGGTSILATRVFEEIERRLNKRLPLSTMINAPTIAQLARIVADKNWSGSWSPLVALQEGGSNPPFFCIHGADGLVFIYRDLARHLGSDQPFYGLQSQGLDGKNSFHTRIEDMASQYIKEIRAIQPEGPYFLGGYCMGGTIAFEMAQQLHFQGQAIGLLVLLETYNWANFKKPSFFSKTHYYIQKVDFHVRNLFIADSKWTFLREKVKVAKNRSKMWVGGMQAKMLQTFHEGNGFNESLARLWKTNDQAAAAYRPRVYPGRITQFRPVKEYAWYQNSDMGWANLSAKGVEDHVVPVFPAGMLVEPFVEKLAAELKACINRAVEHSNN